jgi:hypothetical protein
VEHYVLEGGGISQQAVLAQRVELVLYRALAMNVPVHPSDLIVAKGTGVGTLGVFLVGVARDARTVEIAAGAGKVDWQLFPLTAVHLCTDVHRVHGNHVDEVWAGVNHIDPTGGGVKPNVLNGNQVDLWLVDVLHFVVQPVDVRTHHADGLRVLDTAQHGLVPGDGLGQPVLQQVLHHLRADELRFIRLIVGRDADYIQIAEERGGCGSFILTNDGANLWT